MRTRTRALRDTPLYLAVLAAFAVPASPSRGQSIPEREAIVDQLNRFDTAPELDIAALRQRVLERARSRNEPEPSERPPVAPELLKLPTFNLDIHFDTDTPVVRPDSYQTLGRAADALVNATLLPYSFLIVGHGDATGRREANVLLSQRRADAIRDVLVNTFKISSKRLQSLGLGEEQFIDSAHPTSPANLQIQILTIARQTEQSEQAQRAAAPPATPAKKPARKR
jgi:OmpA-OmpF porin, OOP family